MRRFLFGFVVLSVPKDLSSGTVNYQLEYFDPYEFINKRARLISDSFSIPFYEARSYVFTAYQVALELDADVDSILAITAIESGFRNLESHKGAKGHTQIMLKYWSGELPREEEVWNPYYAYKTAVIVWREMGSLDKYSGGALGYETKFNKWYNLLKSL